MIRVINFLCVALMGLSILALYHVSEKTRVAMVELNRVDRQIGDAKGDIAVLQTEWERIAGPARIQALAEARLGMSDSASVQLSSFDQLPQRGENAPLASSPVRNASAQIPQPAGAPLQPVADHPGM